MKLRRVALALISTCVLNISCEQVIASAGLDPDITVDYVTIHDPAERKAAIERDLRMATEAAKANPKSFEAHMELGKMRRELGDNKGAIESYSTAIGINNGNVRGYRQRAMTYFSTQQFKEASKDLSEALKLKPDDPTLLDGFANSHMKLAQKCRLAYDFTGAIKSLDALISILETQLKLTPQSSLLRWKLAVANSDAGEATGTAGNKKESQRRYVLAVDDFQKCINDNIVRGGPPSGNLQFQALARAGLAKAYLELDRPEEVLKTITEIPVEILPKNVLISVYVCQMRAYEKLSNETKAAEIERKLESMRPKQEVLGK